MGSFTDPPSGGKGPIRPPLRLVHPSPPPKPRRRPRRPSPFTAEEEARLRAALRHARALFGTWGCLADAMHARLETVHRAARGGARVSGTIAIQLAKALGKPLESLYAPPRPASKCPMCGGAS